MIRVARGCAAAAALAAACAKPPTAPPLPSELVVLRMSSPVTSMAFAKSELVAAAATRDHKLRIVSLLDGTERRTIDIGDRDIDVFAMSPDAKTVAIGDHQGLTSVWAADDGRTRFELRLRRYPGIAVFSHDGATLAVAAQGDPVQLVDVATGKAAVTLDGPIGGTAALTFSRNDAFLATADGDGAVRVYNARNGARISENRDFLMIPLAIDFTAEARSVIAGGGDKVLAIIDTATGRTNRRLVPTP